MTKKRIFMVTAVIAAVALLSVAVFAADYGSPAEILAALTGKTVESVTAEKTEAGSTYGALAEEQGVFDEFKQEMYEFRNRRIEQRVAEGRITEAQAAEIRARMEANIAECDGDGPDADRDRLGIGLGNSGSAGKGTGGKGMGGNGTGGKGMGGGRK